METGSPAVLAAQIVQCLLIAFWYLCTFAATVTALDVPFPRVFKEAVRLSAARGKTWDGKPSALGWLKDVSVPHIWFWHFYLVGVVCNGATLCLAAVPLVARAVSPRLYAAMARPNSTDGSLEAMTYMTVASLLVMCMLQTHLVRRLVETLFMMRYPATSRMHILAYVYGLLYYAVLSLTFVSPSTTRTALSLVFRGSRSNVSSSTAQQQPCSSTGGECDGVGSSTEFTYKGYELQADVLVLDPASAVAMMNNVFECVVNTLTTNRMILLGGCVVAVGQLIQHDSHQRLAALSRAAAKRGLSTPRALSNQNTAQSRALKDKLSALDSVSPVSVYTEKPHARARSFDSLLVSPGGSRAQSPLSQNFEYKLPRGGLFEVVSCPHYFGEVVIYGGFLLMQGGSGLSPAVFLWVVMNLSIAAQDTHAWYKGRFKDYPRQRRALFPFLW